jgi:Lrp/AsnC family leucine-responsive transcriptional regulator
MECYLITGNTADYQLKIAVPDLESYYDILLGKITRIEGVSGAHSSFILRKIVDSTAVPLEYARRK